MTKRRTLVSAAVAVLMLAACGSGGDTSSEVSDEPRDAEFWSIGTGNTGGTYYPLGGALAKLLSDDEEAFSHVTATAEVTGATIENIRLLASGDIQVGFGEASGVWQAVKGEGVFEEPVEELRTLGVLMYSWMQIVTQADSGIQTFQDLAGKRVSIAEAGSSSSILMETIAQALGMSTSDFGETLGLGLAEQTAAFQDGRIDAAAYLGALNMAALQEMDTFTDLFVIGFDGEDGEALEGALPFMVLEEIPAGTYEGQDEPWGPTPLSANTILVTEEMSEEDAYQLTKLMYENLETFTQIHPAAGDMQLENITANSFVPLHPGALRYYEEKGIELGEHHMPPS